jgi:hypothetical protein
VAYLTLPLTEDARQILCKAMLDLHQKDPDANENVVDLFFDMLVYQPDCSPELTAALHRVAEVDAAEL